MSGVQYGPRPRAGAQFYKAHGLGNDYLVFEEGDAWLLSEASVARICDRWQGAGSDGIVLLLADGSDGVFRLRMFNPDGSEFERSGNGLRILASHLARTGAVGSERFAVEVGGDLVGMTVHHRAGSLFDVSVDMGQARTGAEAIALDPTALLSPGRIEGPAGTPLHVVPVSVGNPHVVVLVPEPTQEILHEVGPFLSAHPALEAGANVQVAAAAGDHTMRALIWERGVGPTSASGTSACAVAVAGVEAGLISPGAVTVEMEGGDLTVSVAEDLRLVLRGPVEEIYEGALSSELLSTLRG